MSRHRRRTLIAAVTVLSVSTAGCQSTPAPRSPDRPAGSLATATGHGWSTAGIDGPIPPPNSCHLRTASDGEPLPDPRCTPGAVDSAVIPRTLHTTVCRPGGYTASVRPPAAITEAAKRKIMAAYGIPWSQAHNYELDHLIESVRRRRLRYAEPLPRAEHLPRPPFPFTLRP